MNDKNKLEEYFYNSLTNDILFNRYFLQLSYNYFLGKDSVITGFSPFKKVQITEDSIMGIVSRFYYFDKFDEMGRLRCMTCVGINGCLKNPKIEMLPLIEAFCFEVVNSRDSAVSSDYAQARKSLYEYKKDVEPEARIVLLRGYLFESMRKSQNLKRLLLKLYNKKKDILNFDLIHSR